MKQGDLVRCIWCPFTDGGTPTDHPLFARSPEWEGTYKLTRPIKNELGIILCVDPYPHNDFTTNKGKKIHICFFNGVRWALYKEQVVLLSAS